MDWLQKVFENAIGAYGAVFLLLVFAGLWLGGRIIRPQERDNESKRREDDIAYRDKIIDRQSAQIDRLHSNFETALKTIREDVLPLVEKTMQELSRRRSLD